MVTCSANVLQFRGFSASDLRYQSSGSAFNSILIFRRYSSNDALKAFTHCAFYRIHEEDGQASNFGGPPAFRADARAIIKTLTLCVSGAGCWSSDIPCAVDVFLPSFYCGQEFCTTL